MFLGEGQAGERFELWLLAAILASVTVVMVESSPTIDPGWRARLRSVELGFTAVFTAEYLLRLLSHSRPSRYAFSFFGMVDFVSIAPTWLVLAFPGWQGLAVLRVLRVFRLFRMMSLGRFSRAAATIGSALRASRHKIGAVVVGVVLISLSAGSLMYLIEGPENGFTSIPAAAYWAIITLTTVGHGGLMPTTAAGQLLTSALVILGYAVLAIPVGIITSEVLHARRARDELLAREETERREFKYSAFVSRDHPGVPKDIMFEASVLKPVAGFLNAQGGFLFIGVNDDGAPVGIQPDLDLTRWDTEKYVRHLTDRIAGELGVAAATATHISIERSQGPEICVVEVDASSDPVWLERVEKGGKRRVFYVRANNSTRELRGPDLLAYVKRRWD